MGRKILTGIAVVLMLAGAGVLLFPLGQQWFFDRESRAAIDAYESGLAEQSAGGTEAGEGDSAAGLGTGSEVLLQEMKAYNERIYMEGQANLTDPFSYEEASFALEDWNMKDGMFGYLTIPKMELELPIYLGASQENLRKGAAHLTQTSLPIGGENTNAVLAAHRGMSNAAMFREIERLETGDRLTIRNPWETLTYQVCEIEIIAPDEIDRVLIQEGRDLVTLVTCHPYPQNYQRYVVYCERVTDTESGQGAGAGAENQGQPTETEDADADDANGTAREWSLLEVERLLRIGGAALIFLLLVLLLVMTLCGRTAGADIKQSGGKRGKGKADSGKNGGEKHRGKKYRVRKRKNRSKI